MAVSGIKQKHDSSCHHFLINFQAVIKIQCLQLQRHCKFKHICHSLTWFKHICHSITWRLKTFWKFNNVFHFRWKLQLLRRFLVLTLSKLFHLSVAFNIETSHLICSANQMTGFYMKCDTGWNGLTIDAAIMLLC